MCVIYHFIKLILIFSLTWHSLMCRNCLIYLCNYHVIELLSFLYSIQLSSLWLYLWKPFSWGLQELFHRPVVYPLSIGSWTSAHLASSVGSWSWVSSWSWMPYFLHFWHSYLAISVHHSRNLGSWLYTYARRNLSISSSFLLLFVSPHSFVFPLHNLFKCSKLSQNAGKW